MLNTQTTTTQMLMETLDCPDIIARQLESNQSQVETISQQLTRLEPTMVITCARGSSDHAATCLKYWVETHLKIPCASFSPSISSVYQTKQNLKGAVFIAISQSGQSPDIVQSTEAARQAGALTVALVNQQNSALEKAADIYLPMHAGLETSVAATKSFIASLSALLHLVFCWCKAKSQLQMLEQLPEHLQQASTLDWSKATQTFTAANSTLVLGRGAGFGIALEAALKFKETAVLHAEAFSSAEVMHGPLALIQKNYPVLIFTQQDETEQQMNLLIDTLQAIGAKTYITRACSRVKNDYELPAVAHPEPVFTPILTIQSFYPFANQIALSRGFSPDTPVNLKKVTETI